MLVAGMAICRSPQIAFECPCSMYFLWNLSDFKSLIPVGGLHLKGISFFNLNIDGVTLICITVLQTCVEILCHVVSSCSHIFHVPTIVMPVCIPHRIMILELNNLTKAPNLFFFQIHDKKIQEALLTYYASNLQVEMIQKQKDEVMTLQLVANTMVLNSHYVCPH